MDTSTNDLIINNINTFIISVNNDTTDDLIINNILNNNKIDTLTTVDIDSNLKDNLLYKIKSNKKHPFNELMAHNISDDYKSFKSEQRNNKDKIIVYSDSGKIYLEELAREIYYLTNNRLQINKKYLYIETSINNDNKKRIDIACKYNDNVFYIIEFKVTSNNNVNEAQEQILDYAKLCANNPNQKTNIFCCIIIMDIEKIINEPGLLDLFNNNTSIISCYETSLEEYGISIENRIFDINKKGFIENSFKKSSCVPTLEIFDVPKPNVITRNAINAFYTITNTNATGAKNVRERLPLSDKGKLELCLSIFETLYKGYKKQDENVLFKYSEQKTFVFLNDESIKFDDIENKQTYLTSTNAALINGQQSTHVPYLIKVALKEIISFLHNSKSITLNKFSSNIKEFLIKENIITSNTSRSEDEINKFISYLHKCYFNYMLNDIDSVEECAEIAYSKNLSIDINNNELNMSSESGLKYKFLANNIYKETKILCTYPNIQKKYCNYINENLSIDIVNVIPLVMNFKNIDLNKNYIELFKDVFQGKSKNKELKEVIFNKNINLYVNKCSFDNIQSEAIKSQTKKIKSLNRDIDKLNIDIGKLNIDKENNEKDLLKIKEEIEINLINNNDNTDLIKQKSTINKSMVEIEEKQDLFNDFKNKLTIELNNVIYNIENLKNKYQNDFALNNSKNMFNDLCKFLLIYNKCYDKLISIINKYKSNIGLQDYQLLLTLVITIIAKNYNKTFINFEDQQIDDINEVIDVIYNNVVFWNLKWTILTNNVAIENFKNIIIQRTEDNDDNNNDNIDGETFINRIFDYQLKNIDDTIVDTIDLNDNNVNNFINNFLED